MYVASNGTKTAVILRDTDPENPRDSYYQENLGNMVCWHKRYNLGDKHTFDDPIDFAQDLALKNTSWSELLLYIKDGHTKDLRLVPEGEEYQLQSRSVFDNNIWVDMAGFQFPADFSDSAAISKRIWDEAQGEIMDVLKEQGRTCEAKDFRVFCEEFVRHELSPEKPALDQQISGAQSRTPKPASDKSGPDIER